jgi:hypothetical protein
MLSGCCLQQILAAAVFQFCDEGLDVGGTVATRDEEGIGRIDDDEVVDPENGDGPFVAAVDEIAGAFELDGLSLAETIASVSMLKKIIQRTPCADIAPLDRCWYDDE